MMKTMAKVYCHAGGVQGAVFAVTAVLYAVGWAAVSADSVTKWGTMIAMVPSFLMLFQAGVCHARGIAAMRQFSVGMSIARAFCSMQERAVRSSEFYEPDGRPINRKEK